MYIVIDGLDNSGKSTLQKTLSNMFKSYNPILIKEPFEETKKYIEDNPNITELEILEKMIEDRNKIISKFKKDDFIISDRSFYSSLAYQGSILGVDTIDGILKNNNLILPDIYIYMDVFSEKAIERDNTDYANKRYDLKKVREIFIETILLFEGKYSEYMPKQLILTLDANDFENINKNMDFIFLQINECLDDMLDIKIESTYRGMENGY